jgi:hypothetical protein
MNIRSTKGVCGLVAWTLLGGCFCFVQSCGGSKASVATPPLPLCTQYHWIRLTSVQLQGISTGTACTCPAGTASCDKKYNANGDLEESCECGRSASRLNIEDTGKLAKEVCSNQGERQQDRIRSENAKRQVNPGIGQIVAKRQ